MRSATLLKQPTDELELKNRHSEHARLIAKIAAERHRPSFELLFAHYGPRVKSIMMKAGADAHTAEDLVQEVMLTVWRKAALFSPERGTAGTWIFTIARNLRIDRLRRRSPQAYEDIETLELTSGEASGEDTMFGLQIAEHVSLAVDQLPRSQKQIIELAFMHDMPQSQIADKLDLPLGTVKSRMRLAYGKLRTTLKELG